MLQIIVIILTLFASIYSIYNLDCCIKRDYREWRRSPEGERPLKKLPLSIWAGGIAISLLVAIYSVLLKSYMIAVILPILVLVGFTAFFVTRTQGTQRRCFLVYTLGFIPCVAIFFAKGFFELVFYMFLALVMVVLAHLFINNKNRNRDDEEDDPAEEEEEPEDPEDEDDEDDSEDEDEDDDEDHPASPIWKRVLIGLLIASLIAALGIGAYHAFKYLQPVDNNDGDLSSEDIATVEDLTIDLDRKDLEAMFPNWDAELCMNQFPSMAEKRIYATGFSDAVDFPMTEGNEMAEIEYLILHSPVYADMVARGLNQIELSTGDKLGDLNPWLRTLVLENDELFKNGRSWNRWVNAEGKLKDDYFVPAASVCALLRQLQPAGIESRTSIQHFCLPLVAKASECRTEQVDNPEWQENLPAFIIEYVRKDARGKEFAIGFNMKDKRFERFADKVEPETPKEEVKPTQSNPKSSTPSSSNPKSSTPSSSNPKGSTGPSGTNGSHPSSGQPSQPSNPSGGGHSGGGGGGGSSTTDGNGKKNEAAKPDNQGNAPVAGGRNSTGSAGTYQPTEPSKENTTTEVYKPKTSTGTSSSTGSSSSKSNETYTKEAPKVDSNYEPSPSKSTATSDSHDTPSQNAGTSATNGSFSMD